MTNNPKPPNRFEYEKEKAAKAVAEFKDNEVLGILPAQPPTPDVSKELDKIFPTWFKKIEVIFSGNIPLTEDERQQIFVIPYALFEAQINNYIKEQMLSLIDGQEISYAPLDEYIRLVKDSDHDQMYEAGFNTLKAELRTAINERFK